MGPFCSPLTGKCSSPHCRVYAKDIALVFERRPEVRPAILTALRRLCVQNKLVLRAAGHEVRRGV